jgi:hypothetical protein
VSNRAPRAQIRGAGARAGATPFADGVPASLAVGRLAPRPRYLHDRMINEGNAGGSSESARTSRSTEVCSRGGRAGRGGRSNLELTFPERLVEIRFEVRATSTRRNTLLKESSLNRVAGQRGGGREMLSCTPKPPLRSSNSPRAAEQNGYPAKRSVSAIR